MPIPSQAMSLRFMKGGIFDILPDMKSKTIILTILLPMALSAEKFPIERYQTVINRQMFGALPPDFDPTKMPSEVKRGSASRGELTQEQQQLMKAVHFSAINVSRDGGVEVGFSDMSDKTCPEHYFLKVGQSAGGWKVEAADPDKATVTLIKDGVSLELSLGDKSAQATVKSPANESPERTIAADQPLTFNERRRRRLREREVRNNDLKNTLAALREDLRQTRQELAESKENAEEAAIRLERNNQNELKVQGAAEGDGNEKDAAQ